MKLRTFTLAVVLAALSLGTFDGCYTKLMPFRDAMAVRKTSVAQVHSGGNFTSDLNYRESCLSCHSEAELNDRAADMDYAGISTVHGLSYDPYGWRGVYTQSPWWDPNPPIFIGAGSGPGRQPVIMKAPPGGSSTTTQTGTSSNANRRRETGSTRTGERTRDANPTATSTPTGGSTTTTTPTGSSGAGVITTTPPPTQTTQTPPADTRSRPAGTEDSSRRKTGSGRE